MPDDLNIVTVNWSKRRMLRDNKTGLTAAYPEIGIFASAARREELAEQDKVDLAQVLLCVLRREPEKGEGHAKTRS